MHPLHYDELQSLDLHYWWFRVRYHYAWRLVRGVAGPAPDLLLDVGAGTCGFLASVLRVTGLPPERVLGIEWNERAAAVGRERGVPVVTGDLGMIQSALLPRPPDAITMLDVLEHVEDPVAVLEDLRKVCRPGACVVILVPALQRLWSEWDRLLGHLRRYDRPMLRRQLEAAGWRPLRMRYLFAPLVIPALVREWMTPRDTLSRAQFPRVPGTLNRVLTGFFIAETYMPPLPFGTTLAAIAVKPAED
jgi:SAM-dependent methyltransferase